jgi:hypothetical protein
MQVLARRRIWIAEHQHACLWHFEMPCRHVSLTHTLALDIALTHTLTFTVIPRQQHPLAVSAFFSVIDDHL